MKLLPALLCALLIPASVASAASAPDAGSVFEPKPKSTPLYGVKAPKDDPARQRKVLKAADGVDLFVETWLPAAKGGDAPPAKVPTILIMTPYVQQDQERYPARNLEPVIAYFNARGYAVAQHHVRGTGSSGGCLEQTANNQIEDAARVIEYLGRDAPWTNGNVGMYGHSYDAETQVSVAGRGDPAKTKYLKAIIPSATVGGQYDYSYVDGVPYAAQAPSSNALYLGQTSLAPGTAPVGANTFQRFGCVPDLAVASVDARGDHTAFWDVREYRTGARNFKAATLWVHGLRDWNVEPITVSGFFDRLPESTPHKGLFGVWEHNYPDKHAGIQPDWARPDWLPMATAWYDRYLKDLDTGVEEWPDVQLQDSEGQWRSEPGFPQTGGPAGQLALAPAGLLGGPTPTGSTAFREGPDDDESVPGTRAVFTTPAVKAPLHITGEPVADLWLQTDRNDGHVAARLQALDAKGAVIRQAGGSPTDIGTHGARSLQHLDPMPEGYFTQDLGKPAPMNTPIRVPVRFRPNDFVVPEGGKLRLIVAGASSFAKFGTVPSGTQAQITLLHDCTRTSALRFLVPWSDAPKLNVREVDEKDALKANLAPVRETDGGGLASGKVCGRAPERLDSFGPLVRPKTPAGGVTSADVRRAGGGSAAGGSSASGTADTRGFTTVRQGRRVLAVAVDRRRKGRALRSGLRVRVRCSGGCRVRVRALSGRTVVGKAKEIKNASGRRTTMLRFTAKGRRALARRRTVTLRIEVTAYDAAKRPLKVTRRVRLR